jgi:hypothetical protein
MERWRETEREGEIERDRERERGRKEKRNKTKGRITSIYSKLGPESILESILRLRDLSADHRKRLLIDLSTRSLPLPELLNTSLILLEQGSYAVDFTLPISSNDGVARSHLDLSVPIRDILWHEAVASYQGQYKLFHLRLYRYILELVRVECEAISVRLSNVEGWSRSHSQLVGFGRFLWLRSG